MSQATERGRFEKYNASGLRVGIVVAQFNRDVCDGLLASAKEMLSAYQVSEGNVEVVKVAGSVEIPYALQALAATKRFDCLIALGVIVRGETPHFEYVAKIASEGVLRVMLDYKIPIGFGVLTCNDQDQALARISVGGGAAEAALQSLKAISLI